MRIYRIFLLASLLLAGCNQTAPAVFHPTAAPLPYPPPDVLRNLSPTVTFTYPLPPEALASVDNLPERPWSEFGPFTPVWIEPSLNLTDPSLQTLFADPGNPNRIAYCVPGGIQVTADGGKTWDLVPTAGAGRLAAETSLPLEVPDSDAGPACVSVALDSHPGSYFATFIGYDANNDQHLPFTVGYVTTDSGQSWQAMPLAEGYSRYEFGGFWSDGQKVQAFYVERTLRVTDPPNFTLLHSEDGGLNWTPARLTCPSEGPCVRWGPGPANWVPPLVAGLPRWVYASENDGQTWVVHNHLFAEIRLSETSELVGFPSSRVMVVASYRNGQHPVLFSENGGSGWISLILPLLPGSETDLIRYPALQMLSNGALIATGKEGWYVLEAGATRWCLLDQERLPPQGTFLLPLRDQVWWLERDPSASAQTSAHHAPLSVFKCGVDVK